MRSYRIPKRSLERPSHDERVCHSKQSNPCLAPLMQPNADRSSGDRPTAVSSDRNHQSIETLAFDASNKMGNATALLPQPTVGWLVPAQLHEALWPPCSGCSSTERDLQRQRRECVAAVMFCSSQDIGQPAEVEGDDRNAVEGIARPCEIPLVEPQWAASERECKRRKRHESEQRRRQHVLERQQRRQQHDVEAWSKVEGRWRAEQQRRAQLLQRLRQMQLGRRARQASDSNGEVVFSHEITLDERNNAGFAAATVLDADHLSDGHEETCCKTQPISYHIKLEDAND
mmetsp:Transcript_39847/g.66104  ORF Transcript_39847/g.66104 Transcript_39847/m.66104 type:complete len:287 (+) Transcript_39847:71-931(+)